MRNIRLILSNFRTKYTLIDGENFKFLPLKNRMDFIFDKCENSTILMIGKNKKIMNCYTELPFYNKINFIHVSKITSDCPDDALCIYLANEMLKRGLHFSLHTNDKYRDIDNIINQNKCLVHCDEWAYFDPKTSLNKIDFENIKPFKFSFS